MWGEVHGEWMGFLKVSARGAIELKRLLARMFAKRSAWLTKRYGAHFRPPSNEGNEIRVVYATGNWLGIDQVADVFIGIALQ